MARSIPFEVPARDVRMELQRQLDRAPVEHAEALLNAYELLQSLHDRNVIDTLRGLVGSGETVIDIAVKATLEPTAIHAMRNMIVMFNLIGSIDPDTLKKFTQPIPNAIQLASIQSRPPSLWWLIKTSLFDQHFRRGLGSMVGIVRGIGLGLTGQSKPEDNAPKHRGVGS